jgi:hypothetical protein
MIKHYHVHLNFSVGIEVSTEMFMKSSIFWDAGPCTPVKFNGRFGGTSILHLQVCKVRQTRNQHKAAYRLSRDYTA